MIALLQVSWRLCQGRNFESLSVFDDVIIKTWWHTFFLTRSVVSWYQICTLTSLGTSSRRTDAVNLTEVFALQ